MPRSHCCSSSSATSLGASASWPKSGCRSTPLAAMRSRPRFSSSRRSRSSSCEAALAAQPPLLARGTRRRTATGGTASRGPGRSPAAPSRSPATAASWKPRRDRAGADGLLGEEVRGAHQHADPDAARGQRRGQRGDHRGRAGVVDAAGEQHVVVRPRRAPAGTCSSSARTIVSHRTKLDRGPTCPPHSRPSKTNRRPVLEEQPEQPRRRDVQVGRDPRRPRARAA